MYMCVCVCVCVCVCTYEILWVTVNVFFVLLCYIKLNSIKVGFSLKVKFECERLLYVLKHSCINVRGYFYHS